MAKPLSAQKDAPIDPSWSTNVKSDDLSGYTWKGKQSTAKKPVQFTKEQLDWLRAHRSNTTNTSNPPVKKEDVVIYNESTPSPATQRYIDGQNWLKSLNDPVIVNEMINSFSEPHVIGNSNVPSMPKTTNTSRTMTITSTTKGGTTSSTIRVW